MDEVAQIKERYERRKRLPKTGAYSYFSTAGLFMIQARQRKVLQVLKQFGYDNLSNKRLLEIGCGSGAWLRDFIQWGAEPNEVYGIDLMEDRIRVAQRLNPNVHYEVANAAELAFPDRSFDLVLLATCLTSVLDAGMKRQMATEALRVLRDDGLILWYDFRYDNPRNPDVKGIKKQEIRMLFGNRSYAFYTVTLAPPIARFLSPVSRLACEFLSKLPFLNTHYLAVIRK